MLEDTELQELLSETIFQYFLDEKNEASYDLEILEDHS